MGRAASLSSRWPAPEAGLSRPFSLTPLCKPRSRVVCKWFESGVGCFAQAGHGPAEDSLRPASWSCAPRYAQPPLHSPAFLVLSLHRGLTLAWSAQGRGSGRRQRNWRRGGARACWRLLKMQAGRRREEGQRERRARTVSSGESAIAALCNGLSSSGLTGLHRNGTTTIHNFSW